MLISTHEIFVRFDEQCVHIHIHTHTYTDPCDFESVAKPGEEESEQDTKATHAKRKMPKQKRKTSSHSYRSIYNLPFFTINM